MGGNKRCKIQPEWTVLCETNSDISRYEGQSSRAETSGCSVLKSINDSCQNYRQKYFLNFFVIQTGAILGGNDARCINEISGGNR